MAPPHLIQGELGTNEIKDEKTRGIINLSCFIVWVLSHADAIVLILSHDYRLRISLPNILNVDLYVTQIELIKLIEYFKEEGGGGQDMTN